jgi:hypothetical protein
VANPCQKKARPPRALPGPSQQGQPARVSGRGSVSGARVVVPCGRLAQRERARIAARAFRETSSLTLTPSTTRPASRMPALRAARNFPASSGYLLAIPARATQVGSRERSRER